jgi:(4-(4-[2-(gamma-L-glutamylamino)ethyl]phenoxymethyl)furan-2-yl)methanamine synthase
VEFRLAECGGVLNQILAWDIGGANIKAALLRLPDDSAAHVRVVSRPCEIWREKDRLQEVLHEMYSQLVSAGQPVAFAVTMTAELSDVFVTKRDGVAFVLHSIQECFSGPAIFVLSLSGEFMPVCDALLHPADFAATNWVASAQWVAQEFSNCLLVDVGSTTTDILPILDGRVNVAGRTDTARLASGELVFTGALRTNLAAIVQTVPVAGRSCRVASEYFSISGDVHLILRNLRRQDYTCATPDGQPPSLESARRRLARLVCADTEMLSADEIDEIARYVYARQVCQVREGLEQVFSRIPGLRRYPVVVVGSGAFLGLAAAKSMDLQIADLPDTWSHEELAVVPCVAAAHLLAEQLKVRS